MSEQKNYDEPWGLWSYEGQNRAGKHQYSVCRNDDGVYDNVNLRTSIDENHVCILQTYGDSEDEARDKAKRVLLAVNACAGIEDHHLEKIVEAGGFSQMATAKLVRQISVLFATLKRVRDSTSDQYCGEMPDDLWDEICSTCSIVESNAPMGWSVPEGFALIRVFDCPNPTCDNNGCYATQGRDGSQEPNQCEWCYTTPNSRMNVNSMIDAATKPEDK